jgi:NTP pyrophosphatase (non-canonical NTP hydrolase)
MNKTEHLLTCLNEESVEIAHIVDKALRFGLYEQWPDNPNALRSLAEKPSNQERLIDELNDLLGVVEMLVDEKHLPSNWMSVERMTAKKQKVLKYMAYARETGALIDY